jgi:aspartyl protease family protein
MRLIIPIVILFGGLTVLLIFGSGGTIGGLQAGQFAGLVSLSAMGIWIGIGAFHGTALSVHVRNAALWAGIALALALVYSYRFEFQAVGNRLVSTVIPGAAVTSIDGSGRSVVETSQTQNGQYVLRGQISGADVTFLVDTGASAVVLTAQAAQAAGIDTSTLRYSIPVSTAGGITTAAETRIDRLQIGNITRNNVPVLVSRPEDLRTNLLGMSFLNTLSSFNFQQDRLVLTD